MPASTDPPPSYRDKPPEAWTPAEFKAWKIDRYGYDPRDRSTWPSRIDYRRFGPYSFRREGPYLSGKPHSDAIKVGIRKEAREKTPDWLECAECGASMLSEHHGRSRRYCSSACRQRAYRKREAARKVARRALLDEFAAAETAEDRTAIMSAIAETFHHNS